MSGLDAAVARLRVLAAEARQPGPAPVEGCELLLDLSRQALPQAALDGLAALAAARDVAGFLDRLYSGAVVNPTENRAALHMATRAANGFGATGDAARATRARCRMIAADIRSGALRGPSGKPVTGVLHLGIGGSLVGPQLVLEALEPAGGPTIRTRFCGNIDPAEMAAATAALDPEATVIIAASKTFTTAETLANLAAARAWAPDAPVFAATAAPAAAAALGVAEDCILPFSEHVGGRFSLWSSVGLCLDIALGPETVDALHAGAAAMDAHVRAQGVTGSLPGLAALAGVWNASFLGYRTRCIAPYARRLRTLPLWAQQLEMESNGKPSDLPGAPVTFGAPGTDAQHAFFQHLHQSPMVTPVEFILIGRSADGDQAAQERLVANGLAQAEALRQGYAPAPGEPADLACSGGRPSTIIWLDELDAPRLGALLALFEHRTILEGVLWGVNPFDQWGVELGKKLARGLEADLSAGRFGAGQGYDYLARLAGLRSPPA
jgi:glucose-6-phosphate isomerase